MKKDANYAIRFPQYRQYKLNCSRDDLRNIRQFDGFPLHDPRTKKPLISGGDPIVDSFNGVFHVGIVVPISLKGLFSTETPNSIDTSRDTLLTQLAIVETSLKDSIAKSIDALSNRLNGVERKQSRIDSLIKILRETRQVTTTQEDGNDGL